LLAASVLAAILCTFDEAWARGVTPPLGSLGSLRLWVALATCTALLRLTLSWEAVRERAGRLLKKRLEPRERRSVLLSLAVVIGVGFVLRLAHLHRLVYTADESQLLWLASAGSLGEMWKAITMTSPHPPGHFVLLHLLEQVSWHPLWIRLPSLLAGTATIALGYAFGRELFGRSAGLVLAVLVALSPPLVEISRHARNYSIPLALTVAAAWLLARGLRTHSWRDLAAVSLLAPMAVSFHYAFLQAFLGLGLAAAAAFGLRRTAAGEWARAGLLALPLAVVAAALYVGHIRVLPGHIGANHRHMMRDQLGSGPLQLHEPLIELFRYLAPEPLALLLLGLGLLGATATLLGGNRRALLICTGPLLVAYGFTWAGVLPMGATRHSAYLLPFLLALVAANVPEALHGYPSLRGRLGWTPRPAAAEPRGASRPVSRLGLGATVALALLFVNAAAADYERYHGPRYRFGDRRQLPIGYLRSDLAASFRVLEAGVAPGDLVLLTSSGRYQLLTHYQIPIVYDERIASPRDLRWYELKKEPQRYRHRGVTYYYASTGFTASLPAVSRAVERVREAFNLLGGNRVWVLTGPWELGLPAFVKACPGLAPDREVAAATGQRLVRFDVGALDACRDRAGPGAGR
jgi:hypothetical protein